MQTCGRNYLGNFVKTVCALAGIHGKTNHSLRATGATRLFVANIPEKLIAERTGHRSTAALRLYERTSLEQQQSVSDIIASTSKQEFSVVSVDEGSSGSSHSRMVSGNPSKISFDNCQSCTFNVQICQNPK